MDALRYKGPHMLSGPDSHLLLTALMLRGQCPDAELTTSQGQSCVTGRKPASLDIQSAHRRYRNSGKTGLPAAEHGAKRGCPWGCWAAVGNPRILQKESKMQNMAGIHPVLGTRAAPSGPGQSTREVPPRPTEPPSFQAGHRRGPSPAVPGHPALPQEAVRGMNTFPPCAVPRLGPQLTASLTHSLHVAHQCATRSICAQPTSTSSELPCVRC